MNFQKEEREEKIKRTNEEPKWRVILENILTGETVSVHCRQPSMILTVLATSSFRPLLPWSYHTPSTGISLGSFFHALLPFSHWPWEIYLQHNSFIYHSHTDETLLPAQTSFLGSSPESLSAWHSFSHATHIPQPKISQTKLLIFHSSQSTSLMTLYCSPCKGQSPAQDWKFLLTCTMLPLQVRLPILPFYPVLSCT